MSIEAAMAKLEAESRDRAVQAVMELEDAHKRRRSAERLRKEDAKKHRAEVRDLKDQITNLRNALTAVQGGLAGRYVRATDPHRLALGEVVGQRWESATVGGVPCLRTPWIPARTVMAWKVVAESGGDAW